MKWEDWILLGEFLILYGWIVFVLTRIFGNGRRKVKYPFEHGRDGSNHQKRPSKLLKNNDL